MVRTHDPNPHLRVIRIEGRFDYVTREAFRSAYTSCSEVTRRFEIDLAATKYMDSAALGMLLLLSEFVADREGEVCLLEPPSVVRELLEVARFDRYFEIRDRTEDHTRNDGD